MAKEPKQVTIEIPQVSRGRLLVSILGTTPLIMRRMSQKTRQQLLLPPRKKNQAERQASLKHDPFQEFQDSPYKLTDVQAPTLLAMMSSAFKGAMASAALDLPGTKKAQIGRLVFVEGDYTAIYGKPYVFMSVVRSADINRTPDIRTRVILPRWACYLDISYVRPILNGQSIVNLLAAAGVTVGVGDWRPEKGKGDYGQFRVVDHSSPDFLALTQEGRAVQEAAMARPEPYDNETADLLSWWPEEVRRRGFELPEEEEAEEEEEALVG